VPYYAGPGVADDVFVRRAEATTGEEIRLTDFGWEVGSPDWAPDGRHVVFDTWDRTGVPRVSRPWVAGFDPDSGSLIDVGPLVLPDHIGGSVSALWSPTSDELLLIERADPETQILWVASLGGEGAPAFSAGPDLRGGSDLSGGVVLSRADKIVEFRAPTESGADWTPDGSHIVYSAVDEGRLQLFAVPAKGGEPRRLSDEAANLLHPSVSPDGRWVAVTRLEQRKTVRRLPLSEIR
jgi:Tol biopolymer transport system component